MSTGVNEASGGFKARVHLFDVKRLSSSCWVSRRMAFRDPRPVNLEDPRDLADPVPLGKGAKQIRLGKWPVPGPGLELPSPSLRALRLSSGSPRRFSWADGL